MYKAYKNGKIVIELNDSEVSLFNNERPKSLDLINAKLNLLFAIITDNIDVVIEEQSEPKPEDTEIRISLLEEQNLILMDALATTFEEVLALRAIVEGRTSA